MTVTAQDLLTLGLPEGPEFAQALSEANRLCLTGPALETFVRALRLVRPGGEGPTAKDGANDGGTDGPKEIPTRPHARGTADVLFQSEEG